MFAILDIESTGGKYNEEGITEIAIYKFDGEKVVDQFISLINPERKIQSFVVGLTGINNEMLRNAPKFYEVAKRIVEITENCVLVAHNAKFDYRILRTEFSRLGFEFERKSICTVDLSQKLVPDLPSYSLGKLVKNLGIPITNRHRASGDALATVELFKLLLQKDTSKTVISESISIKPKKRKDQKLIRLIEELPARTGVYYFYNTDGKIIYVGKSKNIKKRANQHFTNDSPKSRQIQLETEQINVEVTGSELIALLKENQEIKKIQPKYNRALKKKLFTHALYSKVNADGYIEFKIGSAKQKDEPITTFTNIMQAKAILNFIVEEYNLCQRLCGLHKTKAACFNYTIKECKGACVGEESVDSYNKRAQQVIERYSFNQKNMLVIDRGRNASEKSVVWIAKGELKGMGFFNLNYQFQNQEILQQVITPLDDNRDARHIVQAYIRKNEKRIKLIHLK
ncbi:exonuclease domain-containing protein [Psychroflexus salis]|uniref:Excinuclease cho n=1 Tax=Psychroflexus salis TaxID=1526574 RepID=A0A917ED04_9FLAO|nr:exonuclease domain-containing protein [Psychroflexus salis]GGE21744.1 exonuclease [Psychroflexus salis]